MTADPRILRMVYTPSHTKMYSADLMLLDRVMAALENSSNKDLQSPVNFDKLNQTLKETANGKSSSKGKKFD